MDIILLIISFIIGMIIGTLVTKYIITKNFDGIIYVTPNDDEMKCNWKFDIRTTILDDSMVPTKEYIMFKIEKDVKC